MATPQTTIQIQIPTQDPDRTNVGSLIRTDPGDPGYPSNMNKWSTTAGGTLTFSFPTAATASTYPLDESISQVLPINDNLKAVVRNVLKTQFAAVIPISFSEVTETGSDNGTLRIMLAKITSADAGGQAQPPGDTEASGDVQLAAEIDLNGKASASDVYATFTDSNFATIVHELGHTLGLSHPGNYNAGEAADPNAPGPFFPLTLDNVMNTIMSYNLNDTDSVVTTLMPYDIQALQYLYGTNTSFNNTDTTYTLSLDSSTLGDAAVGDMSALTLNLAGKRTIWDAGGQDTINATGLAADNYYFDLSPGGLLAQQRLRSASTYTGQTGQSQTGVTYPIDKAGVRLAFNMQIENLLGTAGNDEAIGNASDNFLFGGSGNDTLSGNDGADTLSGNQGSEILSGGNGNDFVVGGRDNDTVKGDAGDDVIVSGNLGNDLVDGGDGNDLVVGGQDSDTLLGGAGNDTLSGDFGQDALTGNTGADTFVLRSIAATTDRTQADTITDFEVGSDKIGLSAGVTSTLEETSLNGVTGVLIRNSADNSILGFVNSVTSAQLTGQFVSSSL